MAQGELMREVETQSRETRKLWPQNKTDFRLKAESSFIAWQCKGLLGGILELRPVPWVAHHLSTSPRTG